MKGKVKKDILGHEEENELTEEKVGKKTFKMAPPWYFILFVFLFALSVRLVFLFVFGQADRPQVGDVWHHWQIAYLSKTVGFKQGFLRLWDFKGMEFYWGLLHPLVLIAAFTISGSVSIVVPRVVSAIFGSGVIMVIFLIVARYFNKKTAFAAAIFLSLFPNTIFHDTLGLQEPVGLFFLLLGIWLFPRYALAAGFSLMLAGMGRAEYWLFGAGLLLALLFRERNFDRKVLTLLGYSLPCILYLKYMLDYTGNPIYPIYWNFLGVSAGEWSPPIGELLARLVPVRNICQIGTGVFLICGLIVFLKKLKPFFFLLLGFANLAFVFAIHGFGAYLHGYKHLPDYAGYLDLVWIGKLFAFPWAFLGTLGVIFLLYFLPKKLRWLGTVLGTLIFLVGLGAIQFIWPSISMYYLQPTTRGDQSKVAAHVIASQYTGKGVIMVPAGSEFINYFLVHDEGISGEKLASSFYDPFYYYQGGNPFLEWDTFREKIIDWLKKSKAELLVVSDYEMKVNEKGIRNYRKMMELEEGKLFEYAAKDYVYTIYKVKVDED
jgi:hypothetical protein